MKRSRFNIRPALVFSVCLASVCVVTAPKLQASEVQVGRYSQYSATPNAAQIDLLATAITVQFPERIQTIGEAIPYLLQRSGYRLAAAKSIGPDTAILFALPLPAVHRSMGPMTLKDTLETLAGPAFHLVQDPVHRLITFERCAANWPAAKFTRAGIEMEVTQDAK